MKTNIGIPDNNRQSVEIELSKLWADEFVLVTKTRSAHWNVEGINFSQYHDFFGDIYQEVYGSVDSLAEELRALNEFAPHSLMDLYTYKTVQEDETLPTSVVDMLSSLQVANQEVIDLSSITLSCYHSLIFSTLFKKN